MAVNLEEMRKLAGIGTRLEEALELDEVSPHTKSHAWKQGKNLHVILALGDDYMDYPGDDDEGPDPEVEKLGDKLNALLKKHGSKARVSFSMMDQGKGDDVQMAMAFDFFPKGH
jgi:hypothetical protein